MLIPFFPCVIAQKLPAIKLPNINLNWIFDKMTIKHQPAWPFFSSYLKGKTIKMDEPFEHCKFEGREVFAENIESLIPAYLKSGAVVGIDAGWGYGKSTFMDMFGILLSSKYKVVRFNAWATDFSTDPLLAFIACFDAELDLISQDNTSGKFFSLIAKRSTFGAFQHVTGFDIQKFADEYNKKLYSSFLEQKEAFDNFGGKLSEYAASEGGIIILIDELDRCRPSYAVELLENIKHLFSVPNVTFLLSINKEQLEDAFHHVYGTRNKARGEAYLEKFIDRFLFLPEPKLGRMANSLVKGFNFEEIEGFFEGIEPDVFEAQIESLITAVNGKKRKLTVGSLNNNEGISFTPREIEKAFNSAISVFSEHSYKNRWSFYVFLFCALLYHEDMRGSFNHVVDSCASTDELVSIYNHFQRWLDSEGVYIKNYSGKNSYEYLAAICLSLALGINKTREKLLQDWATVPLDDLSIRGNLKELFQLMSSRGMANELVGNFIMINQEAKMHRNKNI